jgi:methyl-accepting chemotaxis protein
MKPNIGIETIAGIVVIIIVAFWGIWYLRKGKDEINKSLFELIPNLFPTIGILGTFVGIAIGLYSFDTSSGNMDRSIENLLEGLKTAFYVSILGVFLLLIFSVYSSIKREKLGLLSDEAEAMNKLVVELQGLRADLSTTDINGNQIKAGNLFRDMYKELINQSNALETFSTDLALTITSDFGKILNNPEVGVVAELRLVKQEIENLGTKLQSPATDMTQNIVKDLQESMGKMVEDFKSSVSGDTKNEMEKLATILGQAGGSLSEFPAKLQNMTDNLNENFRGLQDVVKEISKQTLDQSASSTMVMRQQVEEMSEILKSKVGDLQEGQRSLIGEQSRNLQVSEALLSAFNDSIQQMNGLSIGVTNSINKLNEAQAELTTIITNFRNASQDINASSSKFGDSQILFSKHSNEFLENNASTIENIQKSLSKAQEVSTDYSQKFTIIEKGLQDIFGKISSGLKDYEEAVGNSLESYLGKYTEALTKTAESLAGASSKQEDILEELTEQLSKLNNKRL